MIDVSVIIPTYNRASHVREAIESVLQYKKSTRIGVDVIVIDDGSTDETPEILEQYAPRAHVVLESRNRGQCAARNRGIELTNGRYVKFLDSDDILCAKVLEQEVALADTTAADIVVSGWGTLDASSDARSMSKRMRKFPPPRIHSIPDSVLSGRAVPTSAALYRRDTIGSLRWDETISKLDDWDWFVRVALASDTIASLPQISYWLRAHPGPRISTTGSTMLENAHNHHIILCKIEGILRAQGKLTQPRQKRLAQYYYKELRILSLHDRQVFDAGVEKIRELDPAFVPVDEEHQKWMRILARVVGFRQSVLLHSRVKRFVSRFRSFVS